MNNQSTDIVRFALISHQHSDYQQKNKKQKASALERFDYPEHTKHSLLVSSQNSSFYNNSENRPGLITQKLESQHDKRSWNSSKLTVFV